MKLFITLFFMAAQAMAADETHLTSVSTEQVDGRTQITFEMSKAMDAGSVEARFLRRTIEWDFKGIKLKKDKLFQAVGQSSISNVYVSQSDANTSRVRVNLDNGMTAFDFNERVAFKKQGKKFFLTIDPNLALANNGVKEGTRVYEVAAIGIDAQANKLAEQLAANSVLKVEANASATADKVAGADIKMTDAEANSDISDLVNDDTKAESEIPLNVKKSEMKGGVDSSGLRTIIGLAVVLLLGVSVVMVSKKINAKRLSAPFSHDSIKVISQKYLGPKRNLTLVRVAGEYMLLGVTDHNISLIKTLSVVDDEIPDLTPGDFKSAMKASHQTIAQSAAIADLTGGVEDSFSVSSLNDVKKIMRTRKYIDEVDF